MLVVHCYYMYVVTPKPSPLKPSLSPPPPLTPYQQSAGNHTIGEKLITN